jgi:hypothetical protein
MIYRVGSCRIDTQTYEIAAHCQLGLSRLCRRAGEHEDAQSHLSVGVKTYQDLSMEFWLAAAERET